MRPIWNPRVLIVETACVPYHDSLWVTVGAAAPVIALAAIVSVSDFSGAQATLRDAAYKHTDTYTGQPAKTPTGEAVWSVLTYWRRIGNSIAGINIALQMAMLAVALVSLSDTSNLVSPIVPEIVLPLGVFLLFWSTRVAILMRDPGYVAIQIAQQKDRSYYAKRRRMAAERQRMTDKRGDAGGPTNSAP
jgi:hypothetical protein